MASGQQEPGTASRAVDPVAAAIGEAAALGEPGSEPPYSRLRSAITTLVAQGDLAPGTRLPSVRALAAHLGLAVNTVAKAYRELEETDIVATHGRAGTTVTGRSAHAPAKSRESAQRLVAHARDAGFSLEQTQALVRGAWDASH